MSAENVAGTAPVVLQEFAKNNPEAKIAKEHEIFLITQPWADDTVSLRVSESNNETLEALNNLRLPVRFSAVWHRDSSDFEIIYGYVPKNRDVCDRKFKIHFQNSTYQCEFVDASQRLVALARAAREVKPPSETSYRNAVFVRRFLEIAERADERAKEFLKNYRLLSFWIRGLAINEDELIELARHVNFYMVYFDRESPTILLHHDTVEETGSVPDRYPRGAFPEEIRALEIDPFLLGLWEGARRTNDTSREYIYHYQILEYLSFYFIREELSKRIRRIIRSPDIDANFDQYARRILEIVTDDKITQDQKIQMLIKDFVHMEDVWPILEKNKEFFSSPTRFEGGLVLDPLFGASSNLQNFQTSGPVLLASHFKTIRNCLVHSRESRHSDCIVSSRANDALLRPWISVLEEVTKQLMTYAD